MRQEFESEVFDNYDFKNSYSHDYSDCSFANSFFLKLGLDFHHLKIAEVRRDIIHRLFIGIGKSWYSIFTMKKLKGIVVDNAGWSRCKPKSNGLEVVKYFAIGVVN